jgi:hypothetical protein
LRDAIKSPPPEASLAAPEALLSIQEQLAEIEHHLRHNA